MSAIEVKCIQCGSLLRVNARLAGRRVRCSNCETAIHVPEADDAVIEVDSSDDMIETEYFEALPVDVMPAEAIAVEAVPLEQASMSSSGSASGKAEIMPEPISPAVWEDDDSDAIPKRKPRDDDELDMTPMVDVTFLLLIFFMVTASFSLQKSIEVPRQQSDEASFNVSNEDEDLDKVDVQIDERGSFLVMANDWERETPGKQNLTIALKQAMTNGSEGMKLAIKVHEMAKLQFLVDAMDAGTIAGFVDISVTQVDGFD
ncbi:colicin uptake protein TolR [Novipirellula aureliae]|uniref:Colicin uptake protein TolR n=1 Tax=Novipirellula aureliae TaxID=2527966 RepID=A0A5C6E2Q6_9BACT|nr:biopolymer transporter ExbD [Novipirellula aureliae]TWU43933.1 colicin uptake protein TolR [Novipirellula aureliae]